MSEQLPTDSKLSQPAEPKISWGKYFRSAKFRQAAVTSLWGFLTATERAIILPTLWLYLKLHWSPTAASHYYGVTMAAFSLTNIVSTPLCGYLADHGVRTKLIVVVANQLEIIGNLVYLFAPHPSIVLIGRLIAGGGGGCEPPLYADLNRLTTVEERTPYIVSTMVTRQFGLIFGPVFTIFMSVMMIRAGNFVISVHNGPGLIMAICWTVHTLITIFIYPEVNVYGQEVTDDGPVNKRKTLNFCKCCRKESISDITKLVETEEKCEDILKHYKRYSVAAMLLLSFASYFDLMCLESFISPYFDEHFNYSSLDVSYIYLGASFLVIIVYFTLYWMSRVYSDWKIGVIGCVSLMIAYTLLCIITALVGVMRAFDNAVLMYFAGAFHIFGMPLIFTCSDALYSKIMPMEEQDRAQNLFRTMNNVSCLFGMVLGGALWFTGPWLMALLGIVVLIPMAMLLADPKQFIIPKNNSTVIC